MLAVQLRLTNFMLANNPIIHMWTGPRNISTTMMRSFENRPDCQVLDEPFYAHYLHRTGADHPMRDAVLTFQPNNADDVINQILNTNLEAGQFLFIKHMCQHMIDMDLSAFIGDRHKHFFLIRDPKLMLASFTQKIDLVDAEQLGVLQEYEFYQFLRGQKINAPIVDAQDVLRHPKQILSKLCGALDIPYTDQMLIWPKGCRDSDGVWASHWYENVENSTGFAPYAAKEITLDDQYQDIYRQCKIAYDKMYVNRIQLD